MEKAVYESAARLDRAHIAGAEELGSVELEVAQDEVVGHLFAEGEPVRSMDAPANQDAERPGERVLVDRRGAVEPEQGRDKELPTSPKSERRVAEKATRVFLADEVRGHGYRAEDGGGVQGFGDFHVLEALGGHFWEGGHMVPAGGPCLLDSLPEIGHVRPKDAAYGRLGGTDDR